MNRQQLLAALLETADDHRVSRSERRAAREVLEEAAPPRATRLALVKELVAHVADQCERASDKGRVTWLGEVLPLLLAEEAAHPPSRAWFGPEDAMVETLLSQLQGTRQRADIAVFTITDDRLTNEILAMHRRGVAVRVLSDDDKAHDAGSDVHRLARAGVPVRMDDSPHHFHHKFAVLDGVRLINGSYNWTRSADRSNRENFSVTEERGLVAQYADAFQRIWVSLAG